MGLIEYMEKLDKFETAYRESPNVSTKDYHAASILCAVIETVGEEKVQKMLNDYYNLASDFNTYKKMQTIMDSQRGLV
jgi:hypothetical protein